MTKTIPKKKKCKKAKWCVRRPYVDEKGREVKAGEKGKDVPI